MPSDSPPRAPRPPAPVFTDPLVTRLADWTTRAKALATEGLPMPVQQVCELVERLRAKGEAGRAEQALARAEQLLERVQRDWTLVREQLRRMEEIRELALRCGLDLSDFDEKVGDPRAILKGGRLSEGLLEQTSAVASRCLAVLHDAFPKYLSKRGQEMGETIRSAKERGEEVSEPTERLNQFIGAVKAGQLRGAAQAYLNLRRAVAQIPAAPTVPVVPLDEEEQILQEARNLARRLNRAKGHARDAQSAARLMSQVKAALSEDRRYASPEEEIEELWTEVERISHERSEANSDPAPNVPARRDHELDPAQIPPEFLEAANAPLERTGTTRRSRSARR